MNQTKNEFNEIIKKHLTHKPFNVLINLIDGDWGFKLVKKTHTTDAFIYFLLDYFEKNGLIKRKKVKESFSKRRGSGRKRIYKGRRFIFLTKKGKKLKNLFEKFDTTLRELKL